MARFEAADVRRYYDRHTDTFVRHGQGHASIHRAVWGPGTRTRQEAFCYVDDQIAAVLGPIVARGHAVHVVDLGCGVGASICYLAKRLPIRATGITLSRAQADIARRRIADEGLADRVYCVEGDFCELPAGVAPAELAFAIESFVHATDATQFFAECARLIRPDGLLVICDDLRRTPSAAGARDRAASRAIDEFISGWHVNTLVEHDVLVTMAHAAGFRLLSTANLTPMLELHRVRDRLLAAAVAAMRFLPVDRSRLDYVVGGRALQTCLANGWLAYELNVFSRQG